MIALALLLDQEVDVTLTRITLAHAWFYGLLFVVLAGALVFVAMLLGKNASHSIGSMRSATHPHPQAPSGGRFNGPAVHGRW